MKPLHYATSTLTLGPTLTGNVQIVATVPLWHSVEGELGKEVDSLT